MTIALTGHTEGIGKAIYEELDNEVLGFSRSNGYNITNKEDRIKIINESMDCDVFINNAHQGFGQVELLMELFDTWRMENKLIINVGTDSVPAVAWNVVHQQYPIEKASLHSAVDLLQQDKDRKVKLTLLALGHVDTEFNKDYNGPKLSYKNIIDNIEWIANQHNEIKSLVLSPFRSEE
tara:strand:+ start:81 stop:617 length:537 start_codon:yes stop_codon:yes gene_type:complete